MNEEGNQFHLSDTLKETIREKVDAGKHESLFVGIMMFLSLETLILEKDRIGFFLIR